MIAANSSKICLISYNISMLKMKYSKYGMIKGRVALPKYLFHVATQIEKDRFTLIEQSAPIVL